MQVGKIENYSHLSKFRNLKDFNNNIEQWMLDFKVKFTKSEMIALKRLIRFSAKVAGVCNAKIGTLVSATHDKSGGISRSTFKRMVLKAKEIGLFAVYETERKNGSQSANVYVFNRFNSDAKTKVSKTNSEPPKSEKLDHHKTTNLLKTTNQVKDIRIEELESQQTMEVLDASFVCKRVPVDFVNLVKCFFNDAKQIEEYWKLVTISANTNGIFESLTETAVQAFKVLIRKLKFSMVANTYGYFYGVLNRMFRAEALKRLFNAWWES